MEELLRKIDEQQVKIDAMFESVEKLRKYFLWTLIITGLTIVLPIVAFAFIVPSLLSALTGAYGLGGI